MTADGEPGLTAEEMRLALARIAAWRVDPEAPVACPRCGRDGLAIIDRSARPYAEWYALSCAACGIETTINVPMAAPPPPSLD
jgi:transcription elongation factor Elf1